MKLKIILTLLLIRNVEDNAASEIAKAVSLEGVLERQGNERILNIRFHPNLDVFGVQGNEKILEVFKIRDEADLEKL